MDGCNSLDVSETLAKICKAAKTNLDSEIN